MTTPFALNRPEDVKLLSKYLAERGLVASDFPTGISLLREKSFLFERGYNGVLGAGRPYFFLQYLGPNGLPYFEKDDTEQANSWDIAKFLGDPKGWIGDKPPPKMIAPNGRGNQLHFEPFDGDWLNLLPSTPVIHVESLIKAKAISKHLQGIPAIGLNGVWSHTSSKREFKFVYEQYAVDLSECENIILFDSNTTKKEVEQARTALAFGLKHTLKCKSVKIATLPKRENGEDWGPDDFIMEMGAEALQKIIFAAEEFTLDEHEDLLQQMDRAIFCTKGGTVIDREDKVVRPVDKARNFYANVKKIVLERNKPKEIPGFNVWLGSKHRFEVVNPDYEYLGDEYVTREGSLYYNTYRQSGPWPVMDSPRKSSGDIVGHLASIMKASDLELLRSYLKYLKYTGAKPTSFPVIYSDKRGVGKGWFSKLAYRFVGAANSTNADAKAFVSNFNAQLANKRLVVINEFKVTTAQAKDAAMNSLKRFFGDEFIVVEPKGVDSYQVDNRAGMIITANQLEDVPTDGMEDRRMWYVECHESTNGKVNWDYLHPLLDDSAVMNDFAHWVMDGEDINFASWRPPLDEARIRAIRRSSSGIEEACIEARSEVKEHGLCVVGYDSIKELLRESVPKVDDYTPRQVGLALVRAGWVKSERRYGSPVQRFVWIADAVEFFGLSPAEVETQVKKAGGILLPGGSSKY